MTKFISRKKAIFFLACAFFLSIACLVCSFAFRGFAATPKQTSSLFTLQSFDAEYGAENQEEGRSGVRLVSATSAASATFDNYSGVFTLRLGIVGEEGERTFDTLSFEIKDKATGNSFTLSFINDHTDGNVRITVKGSNTYATATGLSFTEGVCGIRFDGRSMQISVLVEDREVPVFDFSSSGDMARVFAAFTYDSFETYSVKMSTLSLKEGKTAQLYLYELSGESLAGETLEDTTGAEVCGTPSLYRGTSGKRYALSLDGLTSFDVVDGKTAFDGEAKVLDGNGKEIALDSALAFVPASPGIYTAQFRAKDSAGNFGEWVSYEFTVTAQDSSVQWNLLFPVYEGTVPQGTEVILPSAEAVSSSATEFTAALAVMLEVKAPDGSTALSQSAAQTSAFAFDQAGTYKVIYSTTDYDGTVYSSETSVTVAAGDKVSREVIAREYLVSESLYLPQATQGGKQLESVAIAPDGSCSDFPKILLDSAGVWTIRYTDGDAVVFEEYIRVRNSVTEMWTTKSGVDLTAGAKTPDYYDFEAYGMEIAASLTSGEAFYNRAVNLDGRSKDDKLLEFLVTPSNEEQLELDRLEIVIRDAYDPSNYITIGFEPNMWGYRQLTTVYVSLSTGQTSSAEFHMSTTLYGKFTGGKISTDPIVYDPTITKPFSLYWDGEENAIYLSPSRTDLNKAMLADLDDPATFGVGNEWKGFTTGEAEIGFVFREINDTVHIIVTEFDGMKYGASSFDDVTAPTLVLSEEGQGAVGLVGANYPVPQAYGIDTVDGRINDVFLKVYYVDGDRKVSVPTTERFAFVPQSAGRYELIYSVTDAAGNTGSRTLFVDVTDKLDPILLDEDLSEVYPAQMTVGEVLRVREIGASGGSGKLSVVKSVMSEGIAEELSSNSYLLTQKGRYVLRYSVTDYLGNTQNFDFYFDVSDNDGPVFDNVYVPEYVLSGKPFTVPAVTAKDFADGKAMDASVELYIGDKKVQAGESFVPEEGFELRAVATGSNGRTGEKIYSVQTVTPRGDTNYIADHFILGSGVTATPGSNGITFRSEGDGEFSFINPLPMNEFTFAFSSDRESFGGVFGVRFTDSKNADRTVLVQFMQSGERVLYSVNGGTMREMNGSVFATGGFTFGVSGNLLCDVDGTAVAVLDKMENGEAFEGFSNDRAYVTFSFSQAGSGMQIVSRQLCNQVTSSSVTDRIKPMIVFESELIKNANKGDKIVLPGVVAVDVLDSIVTFSVLITAPDGSVAYEGAVDGCEGFTIDQFGKYYLTYTAKDSSGNTATSYDFVQALDYEVPQIDVQGEIPATLKKGESFTVAAATVKEGITLKIYLISPDGVRTLVSAGDKITVERTGEYRLMYYAYNADYNSNLVVKSIVVS